jgi:hypothetical protein
VAADIPAHDFLLAAMNFYVRLAWALPNNDE